MPTKNTWKLYFTSCWSFITAYTKFWPSLILDYPHQLTLQTSDVGGFLQLAQHITWAIHLTWFWHMVRYSYLSDHGAIPLLAIFTATPDVSVIQSSSPLSREEPISFLNLTCSPFLDSVASLEVKKPIDRLDLSYGSLKPQYRWERPAEDANQSANVASFKFHTRSWGPLCWNINKQLKTQTRFKDTNAHQIHKCCISSQRNNKNSGPLRRVIRAETPQQSTNTSLHQLPTHHTVPEHCSLHLQSRAFLYKDLHHAMMTLIKSLSPDEGLYTETLP